MFTQLLFVFTVEIRLRGVEVRSLTGKLRLPLLHEGTNALTVVGTLIDTRPVGIDALKALGGYHCRRL